MSSSSSLHTTHVDSTSRGIGKSDVSSPHRGMVQANPHIRSNLQSLYIVVILLASFVLSSVWLSQGASWLVGGSGKSPLTSCVRIMNYDPFGQAPFCKVTLLPWSIATLLELSGNGGLTQSEESAMSQGLCLPPLMDSTDAEVSPVELPITCYSRSPCYEVTDWYPVNPYSTPSLQQHSSQSRCSVVVGSLRYSVPCREIFSVDAYCDSGFHIQPKDVIAIRGVLAGIFLLLLLLLGRDIYKTVRQGRLSRNQLNYFIPREQSTNDLLQRCLLKWNTLICHTPSGLSQPVTPTSSVSSRAPPLPYQPVLSPRRSFACKSKDSPMGYSPRLDAPPVQVLSTIAKTTCHLSRAHGSIEVVFATTWKKKLTLYYKKVRKTMSIIRFSKSRRFWHFTLSSLFLLALFTLVFRLVTFFTADLALARLPGSLSLMDIVSLGSSRTKSVMAVIGDDLVKRNATGQRSLYLWLNFLAFLDVAYETLNLLLFACMAFLKPTKLDQALANLKVNEDDLNPPVSFDKTMAGTSEGSSDAGGVLPQRPLFIPRSRRESLTSTFRDVFDPTESVMCVLMSVMSPCSTLEGRKLFVDQLQSVRALVRNDRDIFVVDCGASRQPIDDTENVIYTDVSDHVHYVYFPEPNRVISLYWTSKYWIPLLFSSGLCGDYIYSLIFDGDSGVLFPPDFMLPPAEFLNKNPQIKALYIPVSESPGLVSWPNRFRERIQLMWIANIFGSSTHAGGYGVPQIWERNAFEMTCFNLEASRNIAPLRALSLKANGRMLLKDRSRSRMVSWLPANGAKPVLKRSRWKREERDMSFLGNIREWVEPASLLHLTSFMSKSAVFGEIVNTIFDAGRVFLVAALLLRDPLGFILVAVLVGFLSVIPLVINLLVSVRFEDHVGSKLAILLLVQPLAVSLVEIPRRIARVFKLKIIPFVFSNYEADVTIGEREEQQKTLPPVPPHPVPHWPTVWTVNNREV